MDRYDRVTGAEIHPGTGRIVHIGLGDSAIDSNGVVLARIEICDGVITKTAGQHVGATAPLTEILFSEAISQAPVTLTPIELVKTIEIVDVLVIT